MAEHVHFVVSPPAALDETSPELRSLDLEPLDVHRGGSHDGSES